MNTPSPSDIESLLRGLPPEPFTASRDELFFRAGYAAGAKAKRARLFWPSAAAALLMVCLGLGIALQRQAITLQLALAGQNSLPPAEGSPMAPNALVENKPVDRGSAKAIADNSESSDQDPQFNPFPRGEGGFADDRSRMWQQLANANFRHHGRLTAHGWIETPADDREPSESPEESPAQRQRPSTYLELRQQHLEG